MSILRVKDENGKWIDIPAIKGEPGKDYVLTEADKQEIAEIVASLVSVSSVSEGLTEEQVQRMIDNSIANLQGVEDKEVVIINFSIEDFKFQAEEGMTWREWVNSEYNTDDACVYNAGTDTVCYVEYSLNVLSPSNAPVKGTDSIISGYFYYLS